LIYWQGFRMIRPLFFEKSKNRSFFGFFPYPWPLPLEKNNEPFPLPIVPSANRNFIALFDRPFGDFRVYSFPHGR